MGNTTKFFSACEIINFPIISKSSQGITHIQTHTHTHTLKEHTLIKKTDSKQFIDCSY